MYPYSFYPRFIRMAFIGGFVGIFSVTLLLGSFGAAQTGNLFSIVSAVFGGDMQGFILRIICLLIFFAAIVFATLLGERCTRMKLICVVTDVAMVIILGLLPRQLNRIIYLYPISFAMTVQWLSFRGIEGCYSATPFTTNNLRQFMTALIHLVEKEKVQRKKCAHRCVLSVYGNIFYIWHCRRIRYLHKIRYVVALVLPDPVGNRLAAGDYFKRAKADKLTF